MSLQQDLANYNARAKDYSLGLALLEKYSSNTPLLTLLRTGENSFTRQKMATAIEQLEADGLAQAQQEHRGKYHDHPLIAQLDQERKKIFLQTATMHGALEHVETNAKRFELAEGIMKNHKELQRLWELHDYVLVNGKLPEEKPKEPLALKDFLRNYENARINLTKAKNKLRKAVLADKKEQAQMLIDKYEQLFAELKEIAENGKIII